MLDGSRLTRRHALRLGQLPLAGAALPVRATNPNERLRGVAVGDCLLSRAGRHPGQDYRVLARDWRANVVRLSVHPGIWRDRRDEALQAIGRDVAAASAEGLRTILDWHAIGWPDGEAEQADPSWGLPEGLYDTRLSLARDFWSEMARRYGRDPSVLFELWNEPVLLQERGSPPRHGRDWERLRPIWEDLLRLVRTQGDATVIVSGGSWAADLTGVRDRPIADRGVAYGWHVYPGTGGRDPDRWAWLLDGADAVAPVFVTEWGFGAKPPHLKGTGEGFGRAFAEGFLEARHLNWTAWCWHPHWDPPLVEADWATPTAAGRLAMELLARKEAC